MNIEHPSEFLQAAILIYHIQSLEPHAAFEALEATIAEQAQRVERFRAQLLDLFGDATEMQVKLCGGCVEAAIEELRFLAYEFSSLRTKELSTMVTLLGRCPACGVETMSRPFFDLAGLGKLLVRFEPIFEHLCPTRQKKRADEKKRDIPAKTRILSSWSNRVLNFSVLEYLTKK